MNNIRIFIAVSLPPEIQNTLGKVCTQLRANLEEGVIRWVRQANIHLTLKFLGEIPVDKVILLKSKLEHPVGGCGTFCLTVQNLGVFPNPHRPRIIWAGLLESPALMALHGTVENITRQMGFDAEDRPLSAHLTLGRVSQTASAQQAKLCGEVVAGFAVGGMGSFIVKSVDIYRSELNTGGSIYTKLHSLSLNSIS